MNGETRPAMGESGSAEVEGTFSNKALAAGAGAALLGAAAWAGLVLATNFEIGYLAWGIGALVGFVMMKSGGSGTPMGVAAAVLSVLSILGGKLAATEITIRREIEEAGRAPEMSETAFAELTADARDLAALGNDLTEDDVRRFMIEHGYTGAETPESIPDDDLSRFQAVTMGYLEHIEREKLSHEDWHAEELASKKRAISTFEVVKSDLSAIDAIFVVLGVSTAFGFLRRKA